MPTSVPSEEEFNALVERVEALEDRVEDLEGEPPVDTPDEPEEPEEPEPPTLISLFGQSPVNPGVADDTGGAPELGLRFRTSAPGKLHGITFWELPGTAVGTQTVKLWRAGAVLASATVTESGDGKQYGYFVVPPVLEPDVEYIVSYNSTGVYPATSDVFNTPIVSGPLTGEAGTYQYPAGSYPDRTYDGTDYYVDVLFEVTGAPVEEPEEPEEPGNPTGSILGLPRIPWEGGSAYWNQFPKAAAFGWADPTFFPISVFFGKPSHGAALKDVGVNVYQGIEAIVGGLKSVTDLGISVLDQGELPASESNPNPGVVAWHTGDEPDMGYGVEGSNTQENLAYWNQRIAAARAKNDGRFLQANFGNGVLGTWWAQGTFDDFVASVDASCVDKYGYTSPHVREITLQSDAWPAGVNPQRAAYYGWLADRMRFYRSQKPGQAPVWVFVESARPYLEEAGATTITPAQMAGAEWSAIIHEARGIAIFQHNNDTQFGNYSLVDIPESRKAPIRANHAKIKSLAPVINTQSYVWNFTAGVDTMLKVHGGSAYIFAIPGLHSTTGVKMFTLPAGVTGSTVEVVGEGRTLPVLEGKFSDTFAQEYTHHVYRVNL